MSPWGAITVLGAMAVAHLAPAAAQAEPSRVAPPSRAHGATVARLLTPTFARPRLASPAGSWRAEAATSWSAQPQVMLVLDAATRGRREWVEVLLAKRPNGSTGWIARDRVELSHVPYWIEVRKRARQVTVYRDGRPLRRLRAVLGAPATPTPVGLAAVYERNRQPDPHGSLGPWVLSLTSLSEVLQSFGGGPGRIAIHGSASGLGARSHGCVRVPNRDVAWMAARIPAGTPVDIRA